MLKEGHLPAGLSNLFLTAGIGNLFRILGGRHGEVSDQSLRSQLSAFCALACSSCVSAATEALPSASAALDASDCVSVSRATFPSATGATTGPCPPASAGTEPSVAPPSANAPLPASVSTPEGVANVAGRVSAPAGAAADPASPFRRPPPPARPSTSRIPPSR